MQMSYCSPFLLRGQRGFCYRDNDGQSYFLDPESKEAALHYQDAKLLCELRSYSALNRICTQVGIFICYLL